MAADLLTTDEAAALLGVSPRTLESWRVQDPPKGPEFIRIEGQVRYPRESLADYLTASFNKPALPRARANPPPMDYGQYSLASILPDYLHKENPQP